MSLLGWSFDTLVTRRARDQLSHVTFHMSHITCHVTFIFHWTTMWSYLVKGLLSTRFTTSSYLHSWSFLFFLFHFLLHFYFHIYFHLHLHLPRHCHCHVVTMILLQYDLRRYGELLNQDIYSQGHLWIPIYVPQNSFVLLAIHYNGHSNI